MEKTIILLTNAGSNEPASTLALRAIAGELGRIIGREVLPVSLLHSGKVDPSLLGGKPAVLCGRCEGGGGGAG